MYRILSCCALAAFAVVALSSSTANAQSGFRSAAPSFSTPTRVFRQPVQRSFPSSGSVTRTYSAPVQQGSATRTYSTQHQSSKVLRLVFTRLRLTRRQFTQRQPTRRLPSQLQVLVVQAVVRRRSYRVLTRGQDILKEAMTFLSWLLFFGAGFMLI